MTTLAPSSTKITVVLNNLGQVVGASHPTADTGVTSGQVAGPGQSLVEIDLAADVVQTDAVKFMAALSEHPTIKLAAAHLTTVAASEPKIAAAL